MIKIIKKTDYNELIEEIEAQDKQINMIRSEVAKNHISKKEVEILEANVDNYVATIKELRKKVNFLNKREKKLQTIETFCLNNPRNTKELKNLIRGE